MSTEPSQPERPPSNGNGASVSRVRGSALLVTNLAKIAGIVLAILEWRQPGPAQNSVLILCGVFVLGADAVEKAALHLIDRLFGADS